MCLDIVTKRIKRTPKTAVQEVKGYKIFHIKGGRLRGYLLNVSRYYPLREWVEANKGQIAEGDIRYAKGFHFCPTLEDARRYKGDFNGIIVEIRARGVSTEGYQNGAKVLVAREIRIEHGAIKKACKSRYK